MLKLIILRIGLLGGATVYLSLRLDDIPLHPQLHCILLPTLFSAVARWSGEGRYAQ